MKTKLITDCVECPFCNYYLVYSIDFCRLKNSIKIDKCIQLPEGKVHDECPLKENDYTIKLK